MKRILLICLAFLSVVGSNPIQADEIWRLKNEITLWEFGMWNMERELNKIFRGIEADQLNKTVESRTAFNQAW